MERYKTYKNSGIDWVGEIPESWKVQKLKYNGQALIGITYSPEDISDEQNGLLVLRSSNIQDGRLAFDDCVYVKDQNIQEKHFTRHGDILVCARNGSAHLVGKSAYIDENNAGLTFGAFMSVIRSKYKKYLYYVLHSNLFKSQIGLFSTSTINQLTSDTLNNLDIVFPENESERIAIVDYLDFKTSQIDSIIQQKEVLLQKLQAKRQAIINEAVTRGINPNVPMKHSGVEWLGDIPEHWQFIYLKRVVEVDRPVTYGIVQPGDADPNGRFMIRGQDYSKGWTTPEKVFKVSPGIEEPYRRSRVKKNDLLITIVGAGTGNIAIVPEWLEGANLTQTTARIAIDPDKASYKFIYYVLCSDIGKSNTNIWVKGAAQPGLNIGHVKIFKIPIPPVQEQVEIENEIERRTSRFEELMELIEKQIDKLKNYRRSLISEVVTGKVKVV